MKPAVSRVFAAVGLAAALLAPGTLHAQAKRAITHIAGDLYRFQNGRVAAGSYPPAAPTDPGVPNSGTRLLR